MGEISCGGQTMKIKAAAPRTLVVRLNRHLFLHVNKQMKDKLWPDFKESKHYDDEAHGLQNAIDFLDSYYLTDQTGRSELMSFCIETNYVALFEVYLLCQGLEMLEGDYCAYVELFHEVWVKYIKQGSRKEYRGISSHNRTVLKDLDGICWANGAPVAYHESVPKLMSR